MDLDRYIKLIKNEITEDNIDNEKIKKFEEDNIDNEKVKHYIIHRYRIINMMKPKYQLKVINLTD